MDGDFAEKLKNVLADPEAMAKITAIASGLGGNTPQNSGGDEPPPPVSEPAEAAPARPVPDALPALMQELSSSSDPRLALLTSLKPLLREDKRDRIDALTRALALASMMKNFRK